MTALHDESTCSTCLLDPLDGEAVDAWKVRIRATLREQMGRRRVSSVSHGHAPRGDAAVLAVLAPDVWRSTNEVAVALGTSKTTAFGKLYRAEKRGLIEHARSKGYRLKDGAA